MNFTLCLHVTVTARLTSEAGGLVQLASLVFVTFSQQSFSGICFIVLSNLSFVADCSLTTTYIYGMNGGRQQSLISEVVFDQFCPLPVDSRECKQRVATLGNRSHFY